jgi:transketolase
MNNNKLAREMANCIRFLSIDAIERANSGHPGMVMGMADVATILFAEFLKFDIKNPKWINRDRLVLSAGHGSMLLYSSLYLLGYKDVELDDIKNFRQLGSKAAGHPENGEFEAIETTTGPLGQGFANSVGMSIASKLLASRLGDNIINNKTYCIVGDGCLMEGISQEALSLAGHLALNNLIVLWDNNSISIDGSTSLTTSDNTKQRFEASNWSVLEIDGHNFDEIRNALKAAQTADKPTLISCKTTIAFGAKNKKGSEKSHGSPLGADEVKEVRKNLGWESAPFVVPDDLFDKWIDIGKNSSKNFKEWEVVFDKADPAKKLELERILKKKLPENFFKKLEQFKQKIFLQKPKQSTRKSFGDVLEFFTAELEELIGGSADLTESVFTRTASTKPISAKDFSGRYIHYGVREHAMAAIMNGISLYGGFIPYGGTFLVFSDYMKPAMRLSALMKTQVIYILTHDSIGLGEDGPTHQPVEHLAMLRAIPNLNVFRPSDAQEVLGCLKQAIKSTKTPSALVLSRQSVGFFRSNYEKDEDYCAKGGYILSDTALGIEPDAIIIATGSEVEIAIQAKDKLHKHGFAVRVVSMPCFELFEKQDQSYKNQVLGAKNILKVGIEAGVENGWHKFIGYDGIFVGMQSFGASGKAEDLYKHFKITSDYVVENAVNELKSRRRDAVKKYKDKDDMFDEIDKYKEEVLKNVDI